MLYLDAKACAIHRFCAASIHQWCITLASFPALYRYARKVLKVCFSVEKSSSKCNKSKLMGFRGKNTPVRAQRVQMHIEYYFLVKKRRRFHSWDWPLGCNCTLSNVQKLINIYSFLLFSSCFASQLLNIVNSCTLRHCIGQL